MTMIDAQYVEYIEQLIKDGYLSKENIEPIKCVCCDSKDLEDVKESYGFNDALLVEYERRCKVCNEVAGYFSYGSWEI